LKREGGFASAASASNPGNQAGVGVSMQHEQISQQEVGLVLCGSGATSSQGDFLVLFKPTVFVPGATVIVASLSVDLHY
jgi:hypothetical protein